MKQPIPPRKLTGIRAHASLAVLLWAGAVALMLAPHTSSTAFQAAIIRGHSSGRNRIRCSNNDVFTSFSSIGGGSNEDDDPSDHGEDLAGQFYDQLRKRRASQLPRQDDLSGTVQNDFTIDADEVPRQILRKKFTGVSSSPFSKEPSPSTNLAREREREFNLAGNFERTLGIQAVFLLASLIFVASVGLAGGITDGSDRYFGGADDLDDASTMMLEQLRTDDAAEVINRQSIVQGSEWL